VLPVISIALLKSGFSKWRIIFLLHLARKIFPVMCGNMLFRFLPELQALSLAFQALYFTQNLFGTSNVLLA